MKTPEFPSPEDDGLLIPNVKEHSRQKHSFLLKYMHAFTVAMHKDQMKWSSINYIDLFAGAGIERLEQSSQLDWGSPLIAAQINPGFSNLLLCEMDPKKLTALRDRIGRITLPRKVELFEGDSNKVIESIVKNIPSKSLSLAFLDPYGLDLHFSTLESLSRHRCDLIVYFPDRVDALRNWKSVYYDNPNSQLDLVMGPDARWRDVFDRQPQSRWASQLCDLYAKQICFRLGYQHYEFERIRADNRPIYQLMFFTRHPLGAKIWREITKNKPDGQRTLDFG